MTDEQSRIVGLLALYQAINKGAKDRYILQFFELACNNQDVFIIKEPIQEGDHWIYDIQINPLALNKLKFIDLTP